MANVTITTAANFLPDLWSKMIVEAAHKFLVVWNLLDNSLEAEVQNGGDSIRKPNLAEIAAADLASMTGTITFTANTEGITTLSLNKLSYSAVKVDSAARIQSSIGLIQKYTNELSRGVHQRLDTITAEAFDDFATVKGTDNVAVTDQVLRDSLQALNEANAFMDDRFLVVSPATQADLYNIERLINSLNATSIGMVEAEKGPGYFGKAYGLQFHASNNLKAGVAGKKCAMFQREAILVAKQNTVTVDVRQPHDEIADAIRAWVIWGTVEQRDTFGVEVDAR